MVECFFCQGAFFGFKVLVLRGVAFFKLVDGVAYSLEDHKAWFRRAGALEGLGRTFVVLKLELDYLRGSIDDMTYEKEHGQNHIKYCI